MKKSAVTIGFAVLLALSGAWAMGDFLVSKSWNYKITIEVTTPEGIKTGTGVRKVKTRREAAGYINPSAGIVKWKVVGEATFVDLGKYGIVFDLPSFGALLKAFPHDSSELAIDHYKSSLIPGKANEIRDDDYRLYTFTQIDDPKSIQTVTRKDFEKVFGKGVSVKSIHVEITEEPVTFGQVRKYLTWYDTKNMGLTYSEQKALVLGKEKVDQAKFLTKSEFIIIDR